MSQLGWRGAEGQEGRGCRPFPGPAGAPTREDGLHSLTGPVWPEAGLCQPPRAGSLCPRWVLAVCGGSPALAEWLEHTAVRGRRGGSAAGAGPQMGSARLPGVRSPLPQPGEEALSLPSSVPLLQGLADAVPWLSRPSRTLWPDPDPGPGPSSSLHSPLAAATSQHGGGAGQTGTGPPSHAHWHRYRPEPWALRREARSSEHTQAWVSARGRRPQAPARHGSGCLGSPVCAGVRPGTRRRTPASRRPPRARGRAAEPPTASDLCVLLPHTHWASSHGSSSPETPLVQGTVTVPGPLPSLHSLAPCQQDSLVHPPPESELQATVTLCPGLR